MKGKSAAVALGGLGVMAIALLAMGGGAKAAAPRKEEDLFPEPEPIPEPIPGGPPEPKPEPVVATPAPAPKPAPPPTPVAPPLPVRDEPPPGFRPFGGTVLRRLIENADTDSTLQVSPNPSAGELSAQLERALDELGIDADDRVWPAGANAFLVDPDAVQGLRDNQRPKDVAKPPPAPAPKPAVAPVPVKAAPPPPPALKPKPAPKPSASAPPKRPTASPSPKPTPAPKVVEPKPPPPAAATTPAPVPISPGPSAPVQPSPPVYPDGYDPVVARKLAKQLANNVANKKYDYSRQLAKQFQKAAGIDVDGIYGGETAGALEYFGIKRPPRPLFKPTQIQPYKWADA